MVTSYTHSITNVTTAQTVGATFEANMTFVYIDLKLSNIENATTLMPTVFRLQYSTDNGSTWENIDVARAAWEDDSSTWGEKWKKRVTLSVQTGVTMKFRVSSASYMGPVDAVYGVNDTASINLGYVYGPNETPSVPAGTVVEDVGTITGTTYYTFNCYVPYVTLTPLTIGANGVVTVDYYTGGTKTSGSQLTNNGTVRNVTYGSTITYYFDANTGYKISTITINGSSVTPS